MARSNRAHRRLHGLAASMPRANAAERAAPRGRHRIVNESHTGGADRAVANGIFILSPTPSSYRRVHSSRR
ncbi:hypothetical protein [Lysobacter gummosus]|uniref:hypothetical protein n=1 Tax=Lysobacter gummosus TaxID=262324 RepID=UPI00363E830D